MTPKAEVASTEPKQTIEGGIADPETLDAQSKRQADQIFKAAERYYELPEGIPDGYKEFSPDIPKLKRELSKIKCVDKERGKSVQAEQLINDFCRFYRKTLPGGSPVSTTDEVYVLGGNNKPVLKYRVDYGDDYMGVVYHSAEAL